MNTRYRYLLLSIFGLALVGAAPLAQAHDRHVDFSIQLPHLAISSQHGHAGHAGHYSPRVVGHYHGRQLCHLSHATGHHYDYGHTQYGHTQYGHQARHYDRHRYGHRYDH